MLRYTVRATDLPLVLLAAAFVLGACSGPDAVDLDTAAQQACDETDWSAAGDVRAHLQDAAWQVAERTDLDPDDVWVVATRVCPPSGVSAGSEGSQSNVAPDESDESDDAHAWRAEIAECTVDGQGFAHVRGQVANDSSQYRSYQVSVVLDGTNGLRAGSGVTSVSGVAPRGVGEFSMRTSLPSTAEGLGGCRIERVTPS